MQENSYWCHFCRYQFSSAATAGVDDIYCPRCNKNFCELRTKNSCLEEYQPYQKVPTKKAKPPRINSQLVRVSVNQLSQILQVENENYEITNEMLAGLRSEVQSEIECVVCKELLHPGEQALLSNCQHLFHQDCLLGWLKRKNSCPTCREKILNLPNKL